MHTIDIKFALQLVLSHLEKDENNLQYGLCPTVDRMYYTLDLITTSQHKQIREYINDNRPFNFYFMPTNYNFYWEPGKIKPRIKWLKKQIKSLK